MARLDQVPPEILMAILDELHVLQLTIVILVNRQFFNLGIRRLWQAQKDNYLMKVPKDRQSLRITELEDHLITDSKVIEFLATSSTLERLDLEQISPELLSDALSIEAPFPRLNRLDIEICHDAVPSLAKLFGSVIQLRVMPRDTEGLYIRESVRIQPLSDLTELRTLEITFYDNVIIPPEDLVSSL
ncbi:uncharacterized protein P174DRAFT_454198 [Aspergillus novofumigatus IBT 16806]|uniref:F-box domain-containing protein n=1 Tax=Aspergillus novofumigatus (strain IBT 16806) TaxID=1392255 RepID=A0A2I1BXC9_ASPN1|nr:uncharacterized protein P174DRAFT_454198 [Aspergillus novofumigatus IBT 16806]PKX90035.1 hypothetical protein P174DRAFT_454198 [Aspergillus novofumigatus IBT 16806]